MIILTNLQSINKNKWEIYKEMLLNHEKLKVMSYIFELDQYRAFISLLLQKYLIITKLNQINLNSSDNLSLPPPLPCNNNNSNNTQRFSIYRTREVKFFPFFFLCSGFIIVIVLLIE